MSATLLVLAAGMASRYGSLKQMDKFGPSGESIIDYSIYDAIDAGFTKVIYMIRKEFAAEFREVFEPRFGNKVEIKYAFQELESFTEGFTLPSKRSKPWGTAHAVLCARKTINEPFAVINADDFYGKDAFIKAYHFLTTEVSDTLWANITYELVNTLSEYGSVSRGICQSDENNHIVSITERTKVYPKGNVTVYEEGGQEFELAANSNVSMNFWCFSPFLFEFLDPLFHEFLKENIHQEKAEFFIPLAGDQFIKMGKGKIKAINTTTQWFGVTYKEDKSRVQERINQLIVQNAYPASLWQNPVLHTIKSEELCR